MLRFTLKTSAVTTIIFSVILLQSCNRDDLCKWSPPLATATYFILTENGHTITDTTELSALKLYYYDKNGIRINTPNETEPGKVMYDINSFLGLAGNIYSNHPDFQNSPILYMSPLITTASANQGIHEFYVEFPDSDIDTIQLYGENVPCKQVQYERCGCSTPVRVLKYNGIDAQEDTTYHLSNGLPVYIFKKP